VRANTDMQTTSELGIPFFPGRGVDAYCTHPCHE